MIKLVRKGGLSIGKNRNGPAAKFEKDDVTIGITKTDDGGWAGGAQITKEF